MLARKTYNLDELVVFQVGALVFLLLPFDITVEEICLAVFEGAFGKLYSELAARRWDASEVLNAGGGSCVNLWCMCSGACGGIYCVSVYWDFNVSSIQDACLGLSGAPQHIHHGDSLPKPELLGRLEYLRWALFGVWYGWCGCSLRWRPRRANSFSSYIGACMTPRGIRRCNGALFCSSNSRVFLSSSESIPACAPFIACLLVLCGCTDVVNRDERRAPRGPSTKGVSTDSCTSTGSSNVSSSPKSLPTRSSILSLRVYPPRPPRLPRLRPRPRPPADPRLGFLFWPTKLVVLRLFDPGGRLSRFVGKGSESTAERLGVSS
jgi:hypothetical protein